MKIPLNHQITHVTAVLEVASLESSGRDSHPVVEQARRLARRTRSALTLLGFESPPSLMANLQSLVADGLDSSGNRKTQGRPVLFGLARRIQLEDGVSVHCEILEGRFDAARVAEWVISSPTDLLVVAKPESQTAATTSISELSQLIRQTGVPVWFADRGNRPQAGVVAALSAASTEPSAEVRALDYEVIDTARGVGELFDASLHLVQASKEPRSALGPRGFGALSLLDGASSYVPAGIDAVAGGHLDSREGQERALKSFARATGAAEDVEEVIVASGDIAEVVSDSAEALDAGLIVMGASEKSRWETLLLGGTAESTLTLAPCDVLYVKTAEAEHVRPQALLSRSALEGEPEHQEVDLVVNPRRYFTSPLAVLRDEMLGTTGKAMVLQAWEEELVNEARNELSMPQQVYGDVVDKDELEAVRRALSRLGAARRAAA